MPLLPLDIPSGIPNFVFQMNTAALSSTTASAGQLTPSTSCMLVIMNNTGGTPGTYTTRTAAQMIADAGLSLGQLWQILLVNGQGTGVLTLAGGSGVTVAGTATVAITTARLFNAQVTSTSSAAITITGMAIAFTATGLVFVV